MSVSEVVLEQQSPNDEDYLVVEIFVTPGQKVAAGATLASLEGSKAVFEVEATAAGHAFILAEIGERLPIGAAIAVIAPDASFDPKSYAKKKPSPAAAAPAAASGRATAKAQALIDKNKLDFAAFEGLDLITTEDVERVLGKSGKGKAQTGDEVFASTHRSLQRLAVIGAGRAALQVLDAVSVSPRQVVVAFYDDVKVGTDFTLAGLSVPHGVDFDLIARHYAEKKFDAVIISVGNVPFRARVFNELKQRGVPFANVVHPSVVLGLNASMGEGNVVMAHTTFGAIARIGDNNFISAYCNIEHHNRLGDHNTFGPGVMMSGGVQIGSRIRFGTGVFIEPDVKIGSDSVVASGVILTRHVPEKTMAIVKSNVTMRPIEEKK